MSEAQFLGINDIKFYRLESTLPN